jgi:hypothetical protein
VTVDHLETEADLAAILHGRSASHAGFVPLVETATVPRHG